MHHTLNAAITTSTSKSISTLRATCVAAALTVMAVASASAAPTLINGSLTGPVGASITPPGWTQIPTPDTIDQTHNLGSLPASSFAATPSASPDGGTWIGMFAFTYPTINYVYKEGISQTVSGFTVGGTYSLSWYHANFGVGFPSDYTAANAIEVFADGVSIGSGAVRAASPGWVEESISFIATDTELDLSFMGLLAPPTVGAGSGTYQSIDGIRLTEISLPPPLPNNVPEPAALSLFSGAGLAMLLAGRRRKQAKQSA
jgi:hypothetical protein